MVNPKLLALGPRLDQFKEVRAKSKIVQKVLQCVTMSELRYGPPRLDLFGPPQHYLDLFGPPVREPTDNCSVVIRGIGEEEIYCGPGDKDPGDVLIPVRSNSHF